MNSTAKNIIAAQEEDSVKILYEDINVAENYIAERFGHSWGRLLHRTQADEVNRVIREASPENVLEIAPGPARLTTEIKNVRHGLMVDNSAAMLDVAQRRVQAAGIADFWEIAQGNAFELDKLGRRFAFVFTFRFVRHFRKDERLRIYRAISSCLDSQGLLMFDVVNRTVRQRIDARNPAGAVGALNVFDETYSEQSFYSEMEECGFRVLRFTPVVGHFAIQSWIAERLGRRIPSLSTALVYLFEGIPSDEPLEWIALCQKID